MDTTGTVSNAHCVQCPKTSFSHIILFVFSESLLMSPPLMVDMKRENWPSLISLMVSVDVKQPSLPPHGPSFIKADT